MSDPMSARDVIAGVLAEHGLGWIDNGNPDLARCYCGHRPQLGASWFGHVAYQLIAAGLTMPAPPAVCGASAVIAGIEYVCDRERGHTEPIHECTDDVGFMQWRRGHDDAVFVVRAWTHDGSDGWPLND